jgi:hypothetical protein
VRTFFSVNDAGRLSLLLADEADRDIAYDPEPIGRFNVAPGTRVLLLSERDEQLGSAWKKEIILR